MTIKYITLNVLLLCLFYFSCSDPTSPKNPLSPKILYSSDEGDMTGDLVLMEPDGSSKKRLTFSQGNDYFATFTKNGSKLLVATAFSAYDQDISIMNSDGSNLQQLTDTPFHDLYPSFSPDESKIVFVSSRVDSALVFFSDKGSDVFIMNADGSDQVRVTYLSTVCRFPKFSIDGGKIIFQAYVNNRDQIFIINKDGSNLIQLTQDNNFNRTPVISPVEEKIVYVSTPVGGDASLVRFDYSGNNRIVLTDIKVSHFNPTFSLDGQKILFSSSRLGYSEIHTINIDGSNEQRLTEIDQEDIDASFSPDGTKIVFISERDNTMGDVFIMDSDGKNKINLTNSIEYVASPVFQPPN